MVPKLAQKYLHSMHSTHSNYAQIGVLKGFNSDFLMSIPDLFIWESPGGPPWGVSKCMVPTSDSFSLRELQDIKWILSRATLIFFFSFRILVEQSLK